MPTSYGHFLLVLCALLSVPFIAEAQQNRAQLEFIQRFNAFQDELPREHVALHTDRPWYFHGDRIWFSAYVTAGPNHQRSPISELLYVELYDPDGSLIERVNIKIDDGRGQGSITFEQQDEMQTGHYELRAYTTWALNFGEAYAFRRRIPVYEAGQPTDPVAVEEVSDIDLQLLPEGGQLVAGIEQRVGFKAVGTDGRGREVSGYIENQLGEVVAEFQSEHKGMGRFTLTPEEGENYTAVLNQPEANIVSEAALSPVSEGIVLKVEPNASQFNIRAESSSDAIPQPLMVFGHVRSEVYFAAALQSFDGAGLAWAPRSVFPAGVVHFTVLDGEGRPVAERLAYNHNEAAITDVQLSFRDGASVQTREQAGLDVKLPDGDDTATFSISVYDDELADFEEAAPNLLTQLLMESGLRGHVEQPGYYFSDEDEADAHLDLLMMTQGWRAYDMEALYERQDVDLRYVPEKGFKVSGTLTTLIRQRPLENAVVNFSIGEGDEQSFLATTDENGRFLIDGLDIVGSVPINMRANREGGGDRLRIKPDNQFAHLPDPGAEDEPFMFNALPADSLQPIHYDNLQEQGEGDASQRVANAQSVIEENVETQMQVYLDAVTVTADRVDDGDVFQRDSRDFSAASQRVNLDERTELQDLPLLQVLARIPGVQTSGEGSIRVQTGASSFGGQPQPTFIVDGIATDIDGIRFLRTADVQSIDVYRRASELAIFGSNATGGVIRITTRTGVDFRGSKRGRLSAMVDGYQLPTSFYAPRYGFNVEADTEERDERITLYWNSLAEIEAGDNGEARYFFWANDIPGRYRVQVEGLTRSGKVFSKTTTLEVES